MEKDQVGPMQNAVIAALPARSPTQQPLPNVPTKAPKRYDIQYACVRASMDTRTENEGLEKGCCSREIVKEVIIVSS